jgi:hypothetical protein
VPHMNCYGFVSVYCVISVVFHCFVSEGMAISVVLWHYICSVEGVVCVCVSCHVVLCSVPV